MKTLLFEGSEKKMEMIFSPIREPLRNQPESFWKKICDKAQTRIVSRFSSSFCDSYLLSESSLFIWDHRLLMLTCGRTPLIDSILSVIKSFKKSDIELLFYQRKNEFFPYNQRSSFTDDLVKVRKKIKGKAYRFGVPDEHHFYLFHSEGCVPSVCSDRTIEILMYDLDDHIKQFFFTAPSASAIKNHFGLDQLFKNAQVDDYIFKPMGYSLNGLTGKNQYYTIHVTPQEPGFYVSFETNVETISINEIAKMVLSLFKPCSFDIIVFSPNKNTDEKLECLSGSFMRSAYFTRQLECGYKVSFSTFFTPFEHSRPAFELY